MCKVISVFGISLLCVIGYYFYGIHSLGKAFKISYTTQDQILCTVWLTPNNTKQSLNPYFPSIAITLSNNSTHNAWLHMVYTDSEVPLLQAFIDTCPELYPFYTYEKVFQDAPLWNYSVWYKPLYYWKGHAFAVHVNKVDKTIKCICGIQWGFTLTYSSFLPQYMHPTLLDDSMFYDAWKRFFSNALPEYRLIK